MTLAPVLNSGIKEHINDNRYNNYQASIGAAGITINIQKI
jgi:hypothetical protein